MANSVTTAKKLIEENNDMIESYRSRETATLKRIAELKSKIENQKKALEILQGSLSGEEQYLEDLKSEKFEYLVDNLALKTFIANGGGLDMIDD